jgi:hypothetical protein
MTTPKSPLSTSLGYLRPTRRTLFWRTFLPWQLIRFVIINLRMTKMIRRSHDRKLPQLPAPRAPNAAVREKPA